MTGGNIPAGPRLGLRVAAALCLLLHAGISLGQAAPPPAGQILQNTQQSLPSRAPPREGLSLQVPQAPAATAANVKGRIAVRAYRIVGNTAFDERTLLRSIASRTGSLSLADLYAAADALTRYYRRHGYLVARAYIPAQKIEHGLVTIAVLEGRFDHIATRDHARISDARIERTLASAICPNSDTCRGALIEQGSLERGLLILNDTPGVHAAARLSPGHATGTSDLEVDAEPAPLFAGSASLDNGGDYYTGNIRAITNLWVNDPAGIGDQLTLQGVGSLVHGQLGYGALGYSIPLGYNGLRFGVRGWDLYYALGGRYETLDAHGTAYGGDATLSWPFVRSLTSNVYGSFSYGQRRFHDTDGAVGVSDRRRISNRYEASLTGDAQDELFGAPALTTYSLAGAWGQLGLDQDLTLTDAFTARTAGHYAKVDLQLTRLQSVLVRSSIYLKVLAQDSFKNLDSYEKLALGGPDAVRAYPAGDGLVDKCVLGSAEWRQQLARLATGVLEGVVFYDWAIGRAEASPWQSGPDTITLHGEGAGLNWASAGGAQIRSFVAVRGDRPWTAAPDHRVEFGLSASTVF
jgi:hemolysin activation/secretion protein